MLWFLLMLATAGIVAYGVWDFRRKTAAREAASQARFEEMFKGKGATAPAIPEIGAPPPGIATPAASPAPATAPAAAVRAGERFLGRAESLVYALLRTGLPDHVVFAKVTLAAVVAASGSGHQREQQARRLSQYQIDFVICDRDMRVVAVVELQAAAGAEAAGVQKFKEDCLKSAGIRLLRVDAAALPRREEIRKLVGLA